MIYIGENEVKNIYIGSDETNVYIGDIPYSDGATVPIKRFVYEYTGTLVANGQVDNTFQFGTPKLTTDGTEYGYLYCNIPSGVSSFTIYGRTSTTQGLITLYALDNDSTIALTINNGSSSFKSYTYNISNTGTVHRIKVELKACKNGTTLARSYVRVPFTENVDEYKQI